MGITFRGTASRLKQMTEKRNPAGFQEKSAAGPRDGVGGEKVSVDEAAAKFAARSAPFKLKNRSIMAKTSPAKINMALVQGAGLVAGSKSFKDPADAVAAGFAEKDPEPYAVDIGQCTKDEIKDANGNCIPKPKCAEGQEYSVAAKGCVDKKDNPCPKGQIESATGICEEDPKGGCPEGQKKNATTGVCEEDPNAENNAPPPENTSPEDINN